jgi:hypothetical protein
LAFPKSTFTAYPNPRKSLGFTFDDGANLDGINLLIFDSLQLDNVFSLDDAWMLIFAFPFEFVGFSAISNEEELGRAGAITVASHNTVVRIAPFPNLPFVRFSSITHVQC